MSFQSTANQVTDQTAGKLIPEIPAVQAHSEFQKACDILQRVRNLPPTFPTSAQVSVAHLLMDLSEQLLMIPRQKNDSWNFKTPAVTCPLQDLGSAITTNQKILQQDPQQVTGLAFNPFETLDDRNIVGSIGNVLLSSGYQSLQVRDLIEDIEIMLWRNASMETQPTSLNTSTDHFTITVNITSVEKTLIVTIEPESPLLMTLHLGFQDKPDHTLFYLNTSLPRDQVWQKDEEYTWVLTPKSLQYGIGTYYIMAVVNKSTEATQYTPIPVSVVTAVTQCYFWDQNNRTWRSNGCQVGLQSTILKTQCLCNHLTFFSSDFFIVPRTVDVENTIKLLLHVTKNPVGVSLLASLLGFYILLVTWAWRKDRADLQKVKVTILADNDPSSAFHYLIQVYTGYRRRAATTAQVVITLYGSEGHSEPHHLCDPQKTVFERGALDVFLLSTGFWLGDLHGLRLWHDNSGNNPSWYVSQVIVSDMTVKKKWHFQCNCWLAVDLGNCERDGVFTPASRRQLSSFRHLFSSTIIEKFTQDYLWLSVATRHPWNQFTRVQRLSCCMTLLLCDMVINVMFWKTGGATAKRVGPFAVTWSEIAISVQTAIILFPIHLVFGRLFQLIHPPETLTPLPPIQATCPSGLAWESPSPTQVVTVIFLTFLFSLMSNQMPWLNKDKEQHAKRIVALWAKCSSSAPGLRDKNNPIYTAPVMTSSAKPPKGAWKKHLFKLTGGTLGMKGWRQHAPLYTLSRGEGRGDKKKNRGGQKSVFENEIQQFRVLRHLEQRHWLDQSTKVLFVELTVFNANVNLLCAVTLILESNSVGMEASSPCSETWLSQGCRLKRQRWGFLTRKRNLLDTSIILISFIILGLNMQRLSLLHKNMLQYRRDQDRFISFCEALKVNSAVTHLMGFLVLLATVQLWDLLRHNAQLQVISKTLNKAWDEVVGFILTIMILLSSYAMTFNLLFGWSISDYRSFFSSTVTVVGLLMGISNHKEVIALYPILGSFLVLTGIILMGLVIINLFVSAILIVFGKERKALKKEATLTDILLQKLSSLLGIHQHQKPSSEKQVDNTGEKLPEVLNMESLPQVHSEGPSSAEGKDITCSPPVYPAGILLVCNNCAAYRKLLETQTPNVRKWALRRQNEPLEVRLQRLERERTAKKSRRDNETPEEREVRRMRDREAKRLQRMQETDEQRARRLQRDREAMRLKRANETPEKRQARLIREREAKRLKRRLEKMDMMLRAQFGQDPSAMAALAAEMNFFQLPVSGVELDSQLLGKMAFEEQNNSSLH
ncbi:Polycystic kidney disease protein 1-like 3 [Cricetulus griseus]|uniref:Polycystic kidney disease protein 1-like 3 n=2 Tax=Muroidea TaxID=337687 RepID=G3HAH1_CRIGR|nr:Polycystic kidney disease protein 1-like 3 [Cricetulus griseus]